MPVKLPIPEVSTGSAKTPGQHGPYIAVAKAIPNSLPSIEELSRELLSLPENKRLVYLLKHHHPQVLTVAKNLYDGWLAQEQDAAATTDNPTESDNHNGPFAGLTRIIQAECRNDVLTRGDTDRIKRTILPSMTPTEDTSRTTLDPDENLKWLRQEGKAREIRERQQGRKTG